MTTKVFDLSNKELHVLPECLKLAFLDADGNKQQVIFMAQDDRASKEVNHYNAMARQQVIATMMTIEKYTNKAA